MAAVTTVDAVADPSAAALGRSRLFWLLAEYLLKGFRDEVADALLRQCNGIAADPNDPLGAAWLNLGEALGELQGGDWARLAAEHTRLLAGLKEDVGPLPPYESAWRDEPRPGEVAAAVRRAYADAGFADIDVTAGPEDHLAVELKFLALTALKEVEARQRLDRTDVARRVEQQREFIDRHLAWVPAWVDALANSTREPVYWALSAVIGAGVAKAADELGEARAREQ